MEVSNYRIVNFLRDMAPFNLSYRVPRAINNMWIFWSQEGEGEGEEEDWPHHPQTHVFSSSCGYLSSVTETLTSNNWRNIKEYLKSALGNAEYTIDANVLIQLWVPTTTPSTNGGCCVLRTSNQPFGLYRIEKEVCQYRKYCTSLEFKVFQDDEGKNENKFGSIIGRVFRHKAGESTAEASSQSCTTNDRLLCDFARKCGIRRSLFLPLFKPSSWCCSGVIELVDASKSGFSFYDLHNLAKYIFKEANLIYPSPLKLLESTEIEEINKALQGVCTTHQLPLAQIWIPCCTSTAMAYVDSPGERCHSPYLSCSSKFSSSISQKGDAYIHCVMNNFNWYCNRQKFRKGLSVVGKAFLYHKPFFCRDVTKLPPSEYPLSDDARLCGLTGCYAIWLHSTCTKSHDYVLEFYLPPWNTISRDPQTYLELLLATVKKQLPGFKIGSVGGESCVEVCEIFVNDDEPDSVMISQTTSVQPIPESFAKERETVQNEGVGETVIDKGSNIFGLEQNSIVLCHSEKIAVEELFVEAATNDEITVRLPPMPESMRNGNEVVQQLSDDEPTMEEAVRKNEYNVAIVKQTSEAIAFSERIFSRAEASERVYRTTDISLSREDLIKHFGKKLDDAAHILGVSRSTMKRACRLHKIKKWPFPKRMKVNALHVHSCNEGIEGTYKGNPSCSDPPPMPATAGISHKTSNSRQEQDVGTVTIKATHGGYTIRFQLPYLSRKSDLVEKVTTRLSLNEGSFNIQYQDEENEWILITCDEDLEECIGIWKGKSIIKMLVQPSTNQAP